MPYPENLIGFEKQYDYINMEQLPKDRTRKTFIWQVLNKKSSDCLGHIQWSGAWRQYCFYPLGNTVFNRTCMQNIISFINDVMRVYKTGKLK